MKSRMRLFELMTTDKSNKKEALYCITCNILKLSWSKCRTVGGVKDESETKTVVGVRRRESQRMVD